MPQCIGAIDGSICIFHRLLCVTPITIIIKAGTQCLLQAVVDYKYCFLDIYTGWAGSVHDARVLAHSTFYRKANAGQLLSQTRWSQHTSVCLWRLSVSHATMADEAI